MKHIDIKKVWNKAKTILNEDPNMIRKDICGATIHFNDYGNTNSEFGWEIDHIRPVSHGGDDNISNLQPLQWQNNREKSNGQLSCRIISKNNKTNLENPFCDILLY